MSACNTSGPQCPGGGGANTCSASSATSAGMVAAPFVFAAAASNSSTAGETNACPPNYNNKNVNIQNSKNLTSIDQSSFVMNKSTLEALSESVNQMVVNSMTKTSTSSSQTVSLAQSMKFDIVGVADDVTISNISQSQTVDLSNACSMSLSSFDNVRTDLANQVLAEFTNNNNSEAITAANASVTANFENSAAAAFKERNQNTVKQETTYQIPTANPATIQPINTGGNVNNETHQETNLDTATIVSAGYTGITDISAVIKSHVSNSVTQNFSRDTVMQLSQAVTATQSIAINIKDVGGSVSLLNISQQQNMALRQVLTAQMNIGTSIVNSLSNSLGIKSDTTIINKRTSSVTSAVAAKMRNASTFSNTVDNAYEYTQKFTQDMGGCGSGSSGSSFSSLCSCCICCILISMVPALMGSLSPDTEESEPEESETPEEEKSTPEEESTTEKESPASAEESPASAEESPTLATSPVEEGAEGDPSKGGYYYY